MSKDSPRYNEIEDLMSDLMNTDQDKIDKEAVEKMRRRRDNFKGRKTLAPHKDFDKEVDIKELGDLDSDFGEELMDTLEGNLNPEGFSESKDDISDVEEKVVDEHIEDKDEYSTEENSQIVYDDEELEDRQNELHDEDDEEDELTQRAKAILNWKPPEPRSSELRLENEWNTTGWTGFTHVDHILTEGIIMGASDVHLTTDQTVSMTIDGEIERYQGYRKPDAETMDMIVLQGMLNNQETNELNQKFEYDGAYTIKYGPYKGTRTRINVGRSFGNYFITFRIINDYIPSLEELSVEDEIVNWSKYPNGLFLICGSTGTGKSTTLASVIYNLLETSHKKVITIEKPIEYIYPDDTSSLVVQREVGGDTRGFEQGLTSAMRQHPDVILIGEVRNTEEVEELIRAAESGHLAISTMHTNSVATTINRIKNLFTGNEQTRIMSTLADILRGIGNQVLVKAKEGGRFAVRELLTIDEEIEGLIIEGDVRGIRRYQIERGETMEHKLVEAVVSGKCYESEARKQVVDIELFERLLEEENENIQ